MDAVYRLPFEQFHNVMSWESPEIAQINYQSIFKTL